MEIKESSSSNKRSLTYIVQNIVVKVDLNLNSNQNFNLEELSKLLNNSDFDKKRFPGLFLRINYPKCVAIIFKNGKIILSGLKSFYDIELIIIRILSELKNNSKIFFDLDSIKSEIVNIVTSANLNDDIDLDLAMIRLENTVFEPEIFPGLIYRSYIPVKCVFLVFHNGKIVLTGLKKEELIEPALVKFGELLKINQLFRKK